MQRRTDVFFWRIAIRECRNYCELVSSPYRLMIWNCPSLGRASFYGDTFATCAFAECVSGRSRRPSNEWPISNVSRRLKANKPPSAQAKLESLCAQLPLPARRPTPPLNLSQQFHASNVEMATTAHCPQKSRLAAGIERGIDAVIVNRSRPASARANRRALSSDAQARQYPSKLRGIHHSGSGGYFAASGRGVVIGE